MAGLQRSSETFRRSGSSGLVWEDRFLSEEHMKQAKKTEEGAELRHSRTTGSVAMLERNRSNEDGRGQGYRTGRVSPSADPPSPKLSGCCFCGIFRDQEPAKKSAKRGGRR